QVSFRHADVQTAALERGAFDAAFSRFGVMFFEDPQAAFRNVLGALRPGGRLVFVCWRPVAENPWVQVPMAAALPVLAQPLPPPPPPDAPGPFSFGDAARVRRILESAGFADVALEPADVQMAPGGGDLDEAADTFLEVGPLSAVLRELEAGEALRERVRAVIRKALEAHSKGGRVELASAVWLVRAQRGL